MASRHLNYAASVSLGITLGREYHYICALPASACWPYMRCSTFCRYIVQASEIPSKKQLQIMAEGTMVDGVMVVPLSVVPLDSGPPLEGKRILVEVRNDLIVDLTFGPLARLVLS